MAVYTHVSDDHLASFLKTYSIGAFIRKAPILEGVENTNYRLETDKGVFILTLFEKRTDENDLPFFMELMAHLAKKGLPAPAPIKNRDSEVVGRLAGKAAAVIAFLPGEPVAPGRAHCAAAGAMLADLHYAVVDFPKTRANPLGLSGWRKLAKTCSARADECAPGLAGFIDQELAYLEAEWPADLPEGVVHTDLFPDNVLFDNSRITGVIDFYFSCSDFFAYDLAVAVNAWCFDDKAIFNTSRATALLRSYQNHRPLEENEKSALPVLLRGAALRFLLTRLYDWLHRDEGAIVAVKDPLEYRDIIRRHRDHYDPMLLELTDD